ncbi:site-specific DNA-methyltransferase [Hyphococcus sp. DH-69]|uniref:site-specific DNA-methyltransferase n=1 Tax=Hyphococcus formosus TaxID=3143534 RepID=UPI00398B2329
MEKLKMHSPNLTDENIAKIREMFPGCVTEAKDENGEVRYAVDFDQLRQELSDHIVEGPQERYRLDWPGKRRALYAANAPIAKTLRPCREESVAFDKTQNLFIEGDNLDVLKLIQETYLDAIKIIYIDPPYNTGKDFIYRDSFAQSSNEFLQKSNQLDEVGNRLVANSENSGRFHSDWLGMMYSRIKVAKNLLRDDGVIFISIDDNEFPGIRLICNEIFGENNFIASIVWEKGRKNDAKLISVGHEYIALYAKNKSYFQEKKIRWRESKPGAQEILNEYLRLKEKFGEDTDAIELGIREFYASLDRDHPSKKHSRYNKVDERGVWRDDNMSWPGGGGPRYDVIHPETGKPCAVPEGGWRYSTLDKMEEMIKSGKVVFRDDHSEPPIRKTYLVEIDDGSLDSDDDSEDNTDLPIQVASSYFYRSALQASNELSSLFGGKVFNNPKDREVLARWISYVDPKPNDIVLDFFAGSGTTGHAVMQINADKDLGLRFILVQLAEEIDPKAKGVKPALNFLNSRKKPHLVSELTKYRLRLSGEKIVKENPKKRESLDVGFRVLRLDTSNMSETYYAPENTDQEKLLDTVENVKPDRTDPEDLLFQVLVDWGVDLTLPIRKETLHNKTVFFVNDAPYDLVACFDRGVTEELVKELAKHEPMRVVFRDNGFVSDAVKINVEQIFKQLSPSTDIKSI